MRNSILAAFGILVGTSAIADVRYEYSGLQIGPNAIQVLSPTDFVQSYFVLADLPTSGDFAATDFLDFGTQIGDFAIGKKTGADVGAHLEFASDGSLISWSFVVGNYSTPTQDPSLIEVWSNSADLPPGGDRVSVFYQGRSQLAAIAPAGQWNIAAPAVPEPATTVLLSFGLLVFVARMGQAAR